MKLAVAATVIAIALAGCASAPLERSVAERYTHPDAILFSQRFPKMVVEVAYVEPYRPSQGALDMLRGDLQKYAGKSEVSIVGPTAVPPQGPFTADARLPDLHNRTASVARPFRFWSEDIAFLHVVYVDGDFESPAMGIYAFSGMIVLFPKYFDRTDVAGVSVQNSGHGYHREGREKMVLRHELGHAYGLVNCGIAMVHPRENASSPCHSKYRSSIMGGHSRPDPSEDPMRYVEWFNNGEPVTYDAYDLQDIAAWKKRDPGPRH